MSAPNLNNVTSIIGKTARIGLTTTSIVGVVTNYSDSNKVLKINSIYVANYDGTYSSDVNVGIYNTSTGITTTYLAYTVTVPPDATQVISTKDTYFYLEEGDRLDFTASNANRISVVVGYEEIT